MTENAHIRKLPLSSPAPRPGTRPRLERVLPYLSATLYRIRTRVCLSDPSCCSCSCWRLLPSRLPPLRLRLLLPSRFSSQPPPANPSARSSPRDQSPARADRTRPHHRQNEPRPNNAPSHAISGTHPHPPSICSHLLPHLASAPPPLARSLGSTYCRSCPACLPTVLLPYSTHARTRCHDQHHGSTASPSPPSCDSQIPDIPDIPDS